MSYQQYDEQWAKFRMDIGFYFWDFVWPLRSSSDGIQLLLASQIYGPQLMQNSYCGTPTLHGRSLDYGSDQSVDVLRGTARKPSKRVRYLLRKQAPAAFPFRDGPLRSGPYQAGHHGPVESPHSRPYIGSMNPCPLGLQEGLAAAHLLQ